MKKLNIKVFIGNLDRIMILLTAIMMVINFINPELVTSVTDSLRTESITKSIFILLIGALLYHIVKNSQLNRKLSVLDEKIKIYVDEVAPGILEQTRLFNYQMELLEGLNKTIANDISPKLNLQVDEHINQLELLENLNERLVKEIVENIQGITYVRKEDIEDLNDFLFTHVKDATTSLSRQSVYLKLVTGNQLRKNGKSLIEDLSKLGNVSSLEIMLRSPIGYIEDVENGIKHGFLDNVDTEYLLRYFSTLYHLCKIGQENRRFKFNLYAHNDEGEGPIYLYIKNQLLIVHIDLGFLIVKGSELDEAGIFLRSKIEDILIDIETSQAVNFKGFNKNDNIRNIYRDLVESEENNKDINEDLFKRGNYVLAEWFDLSDKKALNISEVKSK